MDLNKLSMKKIRELIIFTVLLVVALWKFEVVIDVLKTIGGIIFPFVLGGAIAFVINVPMSFLEILSQFCCLVWSFEMNE
jgi:predicted PurR-regulated permease PerM